MRVAEAVARGEVGHANPAGTVLVVVAVAIPGKLAADPPEFVAPDFLIGRTGNPGDVIAADMGLPDPFGPEDFAGGLRLEFDLAAPLLAAAGKLAHVLDQQARVQNQVLAVGLLAEEAR
ncbi:hypothetical protein D3C81_1772970 [compost metagenome]